MVLYTLQILLTRHTSLFNIHKKAWDDDLLKLFNVPKTLPPEVKNVPGRMDIRP